MAKFYRLEDTYTTATNLFMRTIEKGIDILSILFPLTVVMFKHICAILKSLYYPPTLTITTVLAGYTI